jgi:hypothetical protein
VTYQSADQTLPVPGNPSYPDDVTTRIPVITGMADRALQARVNAALAKPVLDGAAANRSALATSKPSENAQIGYLYDGSASVSLVGGLLYARYTLYAANGTADGAWATVESLIYRTDTWQRIDPATLLAPTAAASLSTAAATGLATEISANLAFDGGPSCLATPDDVLYQNMNGTPITSGGGSLSFDSARPAALELSQATMGITPTGLEFRYNAGLLSHACEDASAVVPFGQLSGIANPTFEALARQKDAVSNPAPTPQYTVTQGGTKYLNSEPLLSAFADSGGFHASGSVCALYRSYSASSSTACYQTTMDVDGSGNLHAQFSDANGTSFDEYLVDGVWYLGSNDPAQAFPGLSAAELSGITSGQLFQATPAELDELAAQVGGSSFSDDFVLLTVPQLISLINPAGSATVLGVRTQGAYTSVDCSVSSSAGTTISANTSPNETVTVGTASGRLGSVDYPQLNARLNFGGYGTVAAVNAPVS